MFAYKKQRSIYLYIMSIPLFRPFSTFLILSLLYYIYIQKRNTLSRTFFTFLSAHSFTLIYSFIIYSIYREEHTFPQLFTPFPQFYYTPYIYRRGNTLPAPFYPSYKVNTFSTAIFLTFLIVWWESLRGKVFENFISIVL